MGDQFGPVLTFVLVGVGFSVAMVATAYILRPHDPYDEKLTTYECGVDPLTESWAQFYIRYYLFALVFVVFDVETIYLYPWATVFRDLSASMGVFVLLEMLVFLAVLVVGFAYAWRKGALEWL
ncbi:MAG TPA: NADH-quinone oxidoreductase subunit A [Armatimonadota bacterium]|nr:NADH-quinone oxidoreductase subunit A [Armatimonadota bacterium]